MSNFNFSRLRATYSLTLCAALLGGLAVGCADEAEVEGSDEADLGVQTNALAAPGDLKEPSGAYFASVTANGTGCPAGTWDTSISSDGQTFTTTFSQYVAEVNKTTSVSVKDCQLGVKLHSPQGLSFAVQEFGYGGYAFLEEGVSLRQIASYYFSGSPDKANEARTDVEGPKDDVFLFVDTVKSGTLVYQPCGKERDLQIRTTMRLTNGSTKKVGNVTFSAVDGSVKLKFKLSWKKCDEGEKDAGEKDAGTKDAGAKNTGKKSGK
jgi:hypothetical protein